MRDAFIAELTEIARRDPSTMLVTADLGFGVLANVAKEMPGQDINVGVAEQNMAGIAAGVAVALALERLAHRGEPQTENSQ